MNNNDLPPLISIDQLRALLGKHARYDGNIWQIVEVLEDDLAIILVSSTIDSLQADQFGEARRYVPTSIMLLVFNDYGVLSNEFERLEII